jgi:hypothetical protein
MSTKNGDNEFPMELGDMAQADKFATEMDDVLMDISDLNADICPPDRRFFKGEREAWVYEHGNIAELVFVKLD